MKKRLLIALILMCSAFSANAAVVSHNANQVFFDDGDSLKTKFDSISSGQWSEGTITAGDIYYIGGDVGIGTTSPNAKLEVATPSAGPTVVLGRLSDNPSIKSTNYLMLDSTGAEAGINWFSDDDVILAYGGGYVGIGEDGRGPEAKLHIRGGGSQVLRIESNTGNPTALEFVRSGDQRDWQIINNGGDLRINSKTTGSYAADPKMIIDSAGRVGIGATSELTERLNVNGVIKLRSIKDWDSTSFYLDPNGESALLNLIINGGLCFGSTDCIAGWNEIGGGPGTCSDCDGRFVNTGESAFLNNLEVTENVDVAGTVFMGYEIVTATGTTTADAVCPSGKKVLGGGCDAGSGCQIEIAMPYASPTSSYWCRSADCGGSLRAYAICARVGD
ncbi:MAG: hypothetical protein ABH864_01665 [archaeon]